MGKATNRSALFLDRAYIDQKFVELRSDIMATLDAKFRMVQDRENKIISLFEGTQRPEKRITKAPAEKLPSVPEEIAWKMDMRRRVDKMVKEYPELYADFNTVLRRVYGKMRDVYGFVSEQAIKDGSYKMQRDFTVAVNESLKETAGEDVYNAVNAFFFLEVADVGAEVFNHFPAGGALHDIVAFETLCVVVVKSGLHGHDLLQFLFYGENVFLFEDFGVHCRLECVGGINVPRAEHYVVEVGNRNNLVVFEIFFVFAFADTDFVVLSHGADRLGKTFAGHEDTGHECRAHGSEADNEHTEFTGGGLNVCSFHFSDNNEFFDIFWIRNVTSALLQHVAVRLRRKTR